MVRALAISSLVCVIGAVVLLFLPDPWAKAEHRAIQDAKRLAVLLETPDKVSWRLMEEVPLLRAMIWDEDGARRYPPPVGMTPLPYVFSDDAERRLTSFQAEIETGDWTSFDMSGNELLYCHAKPAACLVYDRLGLEEALQLHHGALVSKTPKRVSAMLLLVASGVLAGAGLWLKRRSTPRGSTYRLVRSRHIAIRDMLEVSLTPRDLKLLSVLEERGGGVVTKDELYDAGWGRDYMPNSRALDQHIINLRRKLDPDKSRPVLIETVHGVGYRLVT